MEPETHPTNEEIASLADGKLSEPMAEEMLQHLYRCRTCMAAYVEAVRYRAAWLAAPEAFKPPKDLLERARHVDVGNAIAPRQPVWRRSSVLWPTAAAVLVVAWVTSQLGTPAPAADLPPAISEALALRSAAAGDLMLPGATQFVTPTDTLRGESESAARDSEVVAARLAYESVRHGRSVPSKSFARAAYPYAAGLLLQDQVDHARTVVLEALDRAPGDCPCLSLAALIARQEHDDRGAQRYLADATRQGCRDAVTRIDAAILQAERRDTAQANPVFRELAGRADGLGARARQALAVE